MLPLQRASEPGVHGVVEGIWLHGKRTAICEIALTRACMGLGHPWLVPGTVLKYSSALGNSPWPWPFILAGKIIEIPALIAMCHEQSLRPGYCRSPPQPDSGRQFVEGAMMGGVIVIVAKYMSAPQSLVESLFCGLAPGNSVYTPSA